jgi:hypothetical protein
LDVLNRFSYGPIFRVFRGPARIAVQGIVLIALGASAWADDCEAHLGAVRYATRLPYDSTPLLPMSPGIDEFSKTAISSGLMKRTFTLQGITFDSNYDNGSLFSATSASTNVFNLGLFVEDNLDGLGTRKYQFRFRMTGVAGRTITLNLDHSENPRPFISLDGGASWRRLTSTEAPNSSSMALAFGAAQNTAELAFFEPLGYAETRDRVNAIVMAGQGATTEVLGLSHQGREQWLVTITDPTISATNKKRVWVHARAHAGEVTSAHAALGFLDQVTTDSPLGRTLRKNCIIHILPCLNVDGVYLGLTRWDSQGIDPERQWPNPSRIPEVANIRSRVDLYMASANPVLICLNLHSTVGSYTDSFFFKHVQPSVTAAFEIIQQNYINALNAATPLFNNLSAQTSQLSPDLFIESYMWNNWAESVMAMTHEGHFHRRITDNQYITGADYQQLGRAQAAALLQYFNIPEEAAVEAWKAYD